MNIPTPNAIVPTNDVFSDEQIVRFNPSCNLQTVRDGRGGIFTWVPPEPILEWNMLIFHPNKIRGNHYTIFGYKGKQVRDNIHSYDLVNMFWHFYQNPRAGEVYNAGGGRFANCSMLEAIELCEEISGNKMNYSYSETNRIGDHIWYISNLNKFKEHYPDWNWKYDLKSTLIEMNEKMNERIVNT